MLFIEENPMLSHLSSTKITFLSTGISSYWLSHLGIVKITSRVQSESHPLMSDSLRPHGLYSPWNSPGQTTGMGSLSLFQWIFPTQGSNPGLPHCMRFPYQLSHKGSPRAQRLILNIVRERVLLTEYILYIKLCFNSYSKMLMIFKGF